MEKKIVIGIVLFAIFIMLAIPKEAKAENEDIYTFEEWSLDNGYLMQADSSETQTKLKFNYNEQRKYFVFERKWNVSEDYIFCVEYYTRTYPVKFYKKDATQECYLYCKALDGYSHSDLTFRVYYYNNDGWLYYSGTTDDYLSSTKDLDLVLDYGENYKINREWEYKMTPLYISEPIYADDTFSSILYDITKTPVYVPDSSLKLTNISNTGFVYNGLTYEWSPEVIQYIENNNLTDYLVFYDDYNKKLDFIWAFDDIFAEAYLKKTGLRWYEYYFQIITEPNNTSVMPYIITSYQIETDGTLSYIDELKYYDSENNHLFSYGWNNADYEPHMDDFSTFSTYQEYVLNNNIVVSNCDIYNNSGVLIKESVDLNTDIITPDKEPDTDFGSFKHYLYEKLPIIGTVEVFIAKFKNVLRTMEDTNTPPEIIMKVDDFYGYTGEINVLDLSWYEPYREYVKAIISALLIVPFILWVYRKGLPDAIGGI